MSQVDENIDIILNNESGAFAFRNSEEKNLTLMIYSKILDSLEYDVLFFKNNFNGIKNAQAGISRISGQQHDFHAKGLGHNVVERKQLFGEGEGLPSLQGRILVLYLISRIGFKPLLFKD